MNRSSRDPGRPGRPNEDTIVPRLLDAVESLCARRAPHTVRMQDVAAEAGLSVGAAYRYFDSKTDLFGAALNRMAERIAEAATSTDGPETAFRSILRAFAADPAFIRIGTAALLDGQDVSLMMSGHPAARDLVSQAQERGDPDPRTLAGVVLMAGLGAALYAEVINRALERSDDDERVSRATASMVAAWVADPGTRATRGDCEEP